MFRQVAAAGCAVTAALSACALGPARAPDGAPPAEAVVLELETASWAAWQAHDAPFFEQFLADDHLDVHASGIADKAAVVAAVRSAACSVRSRSLGPMKATRVAEHALLLTYRAEQDTLCGTARVPSPVRVASLYAYRNGRWVNVLFQQTPIR